MGYLRNAAVVAASAIAVVLLLQATETPRSCGSRDLPPPLAGQARSVVAGSSRESTLRAFTVALKNGNFVENSEMLQAIVGDAAEVSRYLNRPRSHDLNSRPSMQRTFDRLQGLIRESRVQPKASMFPALAITFRSWDFPLLLNRIAISDTPAERYLFVMLGHNAVAEAFLQAVQSALGRQFITFVVLPDRAPMAAGWNEALRWAYLGSSPLEPFFLTFADVRAIPAPGAMPEFCKAAYKSVSEGALIAFMARFALFAVSPSAARELGTFDENLFVGFDAEYRLRAVSAGKLQAPFVASHGSNRPGEGFFVVSEPSMEVGRTTLPADGADTRRLHSRAGTAAYIQVKWGVAIADVTDGFSDRRGKQPAPLGHPFNNPGIPHNNSWALDERHAACVKDQQQPSPCVLDTTLAEKLEVQLG